MHTESRVVSEDCSSSTCDLDAFGEAEEREAARAACEVTTGGDVADSYSSAGGRGQRAAHPIRGAIPAKVAACRLEQ
jgi:hypothetical protein